MALSLQVGYGAGGSILSSIEAAGLNGDGFSDLDTAKLGGSLDVFIGNGDGTFSQRISYVSAWTIIEVDIADFNGDGALDLATADWESGSGHTVSVLIGNGDGTFNRRGSYRTGVAAASFYVTGADVNGDGAADLVTADWGATGDGTSTSVLIGNGNGTFKAGTSFSTGYFGLDSLRIQGSREQSGGR